MYKKYSALLCGAILLAAQFASSLHAAVIPGVSIKAISLEFINGIDQRRGTNLLNGQGLYGDVHTVTASGNMWLNSSTTAGAYSNAFVTFDLGSVHTLDQLKVWNYNESAANTQRGIQRAHISYSTDDITYTTNLANFTFTRAPGTFSAFPQTINMGVSARYVRINVLTNYSSAGSDNRVGLSKVLFIDNTVPPTLQYARKNYSSNQVTLKFSESVLPVTATNLANYSIQSGATTATVLNAAMGTYNDTVVLQTTPLDGTLIYTLTASNVKDAANVISITNNSQVTIDSELILWLKADAGVTADGSGLVSQWNDQSGLGNNAVQLDPNTQPLLSAGVANGNPAIHFDGGLQMMEIAHNATVAVDRDITVYAVVNVDTITGPVAHNVISKVNTNQPASFDLQVARTSGRANFVRGNGNSSAAFTGSAALTAGSYYMVAVVMKGTNASSYLNGNFNGTAAIASGIGDMGTPIRLGVRADAGTRFQGYLAELMLFRGALTSLEQSKIDNYLGAKYGISVVPLTIVQQPMSVTQKVGKTANFWVNAVAGSPTINYQWQKNSINISGATSNVYTTPALTLGDSGATYSVIISTPAGISTNSATATLTVVSDTQAPTIYSATRKTGTATDLLVVYSEAVTPLTATNLANYALDHGATISAATINSTSNQVTLTTSGLDTNTLYALTVQNVKDSFNNTLATTTVQILPSNLALWLNAGSGVVTNGANLVTEWDDQTANRNDATQYIGPGYYPTLAPGAINNQPAIHFNTGASNFMQVASSTSLVMNSNLTIFVVVNIPDMSLNNELISKTLNNLAAPFDYYTIASTTRFYHGNGTANYALLTGAPPSAGVPHILSVSCEANTITLSTDGTNIASSTIVTNITDTGSPLRIGGRNDLAQFLNGDMAEVLIFSSALSTSERSGVNTYLSTKYFPFSFVQQPVDLTRLEGQTATFAAQPSQGAATFTYQWQKNLSNIPNATNASYTTPLLVQADSGSTYRVVVSTPGFSTNSVTATLTVLPDNELPTVISAGKKFWNQTQIEVVFSESVNPSTATNIANYLLDNGATITGATFGDAPNKIVLTTSGFNPANPYSLTVQNIRDLYNNMIVTGAVSVGLYPTSLSLWLKADTGVTFDAQNLVSAWADQSGNGNNVGSINDSAPLFSTNPIDGLAALTFNGTNQFLAANDSPSLAITGDITIYVVTQVRDFTSTTNEIGLVEKSDSNFPAPFDYYLVRSSGLPRFYRGAGIGAPTGNTTGTNAPALGSVHVLSVMQSGTQVIHFLDSKTNGVGTITVAAGDTGKALGIGTRDDLRPRMNGDIQEVLLFSASLPDVDRTAIDSYLTSKYGILVGTPPKLSIALNASGNIVLTWPTANLTFTLESSSVVSGGTWTTVPNTVVNNNGTSQVTISAPTGQKYYRLRK